LLTDLYYTGKVNNSKLVFSLLPIVIIICILSNWWILDISGIGSTSNYIDLKWFYDYSECIRKLEDIFKSSGTACNSDFNYGPLTSLFFWFLTKSKIPLDLVGLLTLVSVVILLVIISIKFGSSSFKSRVYQCLLILSPGNILLFERGNIDGIIFIFLTLAILQWYGKKDNILLLALVLISLFKFYTFIVVIIFLCARTLKLKYKLILIAIYLCTIAFFASLILEKIPYNWFLSFGSYLPAAYIDFTMREFNLNWRVIEYLSSGIIVRSITGVFIFFTVFSLALKLSHTYKNLVLDIKEIPFTRSTLDMYLLSMVSVFLVCFFFNTNYDYRLIYLTPILIIIELKIMNLGKNYNLWILLSLIFTWMGSVYSAPWYLMHLSQFIGDLVANLIVGILIVFVGKIRHNGIISN
jgi:hypothetical protein